MATTRYGDEIDTGDVQQKDYNRLQRGICILFELSSKRKVKTSVLAKRYGKSRQTIRNDMAAFSTMNIPIYYDPDSREWKVLGKWSVESMIPKAMAS